MLGSYLWGILTKDIIPPFPAIYYLAGIIFSDVILLSITAYYQAKHNSKIYISIKLFQSLGQLGLITFFIVVTNLGLEGVLLGHMLGSGIAFLVGGTLIIFNEIDLGAKFDGKFINQSLSYGLPLIPHSISIWIRNASDRIILTLFVPFAMVGIYHFGFTIGLGLGVLVNSLDIAYAPYFYRLMEDKIKEAEEIIINYSKIYILFLSTTSMLILVNLNDIIIIVGGIKYEEAQVIAPIIVASFFIHGLYTIFVKPIFHFKKTRILPYLTSVPAAIGVLANIYLIPIYDYRVAAYINLAVFLFTALSVLIYTQKIFFIRFPKSFLLITIEVLIVAFYTTSSLYQGVSNFEFIYESFLMLGLGYINYKVILNMNLNKVIKSLSQFQ